MYAVGTVRIQTHIPTEFAEDFDDGIVFLRTGTDGIPQTPDDFVELTVFLLTIRSEKVIDGDIKNACDDGEHFDVGIRSAVFPAADGLEGNSELFGKLVLRHIGGAAEIAEVLSDVQFHDGSLSL